MAVMFADPALMHQGSNFKTAEKIRVYKYDTVNGWFDYTGYSEPSSDSSFLTVELVDGGYGDADGTANGIIVDPLGTNASTAGDPDDSGDDDSQDAWRRGRQRLRWSQQRLFHIFRSGVKGKAKSAKGGGKSGCQRNPGRPEDRPGS